MIDLNEQLAMLKEKYPLIGHTGSSCLYTSVRRMKAEKEYDAFRVRQDADYISDFDREVKRLKGKKD